MLIRQPDDVTAAQFTKAREQIVRRKGLPQLAALHLEEQAEGSAAQTMHIGPYAAEVPTIALLHNIIAAQGHTARGKGHEIYLGDPRRTAPERLKTILRQPIERE